eukprot:CAMPEP_0172649990 /NCGR_PEP_ID=MMETSP1068-20121228/242067_1 /TAXON_ID=35684 /ORGANISM="Pseudopedinella elastica, Strain CCMP716" /LENGTH=807 /DNA_ID=CAMNT_0013464351 /DNA_START=316 /DNA_END=2736 /DNA_ORIENTATION=+
MTDEQQNAPALITILDPPRHAPWMPMVPLSLDVNVYGGNISNSARIRSRPDTFQLCYQGYLKGVEGGSFAPRCRSLLDATILGKVAVPAPRDFRVGGAAIAAWLQGPGEGASKGAKLGRVAVELGPPRIAFLDAGGAIDSTLGQEPRRRRDSYHQGAGFREVAKCPEEGGGARCIIRIVSPTPGKAWAPELEVSIDVDVSCGAAEATKEGTRGGASEGCALVRQAPGEFDLCYWGGHETDEPVCSPLVPSRPGPLPRVRLAPPSPPPFEPFEPFGWDQGATRGRAPPKRAAAQAGRAERCGRVPFVEAWLVRRAERPDGKGAEATTRPVVGRTRVFLEAPFETPARDQGRQAAAAAGRGGGVDGGDGDEGGAGRGGGDGGGDGARSERGPWAGPWAGKAGDGSGAGLFDLVSIIVQGPAHPTSVKAVVEAYVLKACHVVVSCWESPSPSPAAAAAAPAAGRGEALDATRAVADLTAVLWAPLEAALARGPAAAAAAPAAGRGEALDATRAVADLTAVLWAPLEAALGPGRPAGTRQGAHEGTSAVREVGYPGMSNKKKVAAAGADSKAGGGLKRRGRVTVLLQALPPADPGTGFALVTALYQFASTLSALERCSTPYALKTRSDEAFYRPHHILRTMVSHPSQLTVGPIVLAGVGVSDHLFGAATPLLRCAAGRVVGLLTAQEATATHEKSDSGPAPNSPTGQNNSNSGGGLDSGGGGVEGKSFALEDLVFPGPEPVTPESLLLRAFVSCHPEGRSAAAQAAAQGAVLALPPRPPPLCEKDARLADAAAEAARAAWEPEPPAAADAG